jgi:hypothetical protein
MKTKALIALAVAGAFALPFSAQAKDTSSPGDNLILAQAGGAGGAGGGAGSEGSRSGSTSAGGAGSDITNPAVKSQIPPATGTTSPGTASTGTAAAGSSSAIFSRMDSNRDGYVSREEARAHTDLTGQFSTLDKDGDGRLSASEMSGWSGASSGASGSSVTGSSAGGPASSGVGNAPANTANPGSGPGSSPAPGSPGATTGGQPKVPSSTGSK